MKRVLKAIIGAFILAMSINTMVLAYNVPENLRVGLEYKYKEVSAVPIGNTTVKIDSNENYSGEAEISSISGFSVSMPQGKAVDTKGNYNSYDDAVYALRDFKDYQAVPAYLGKKSWGVYICNLSDSEAQSVARNVGGTIVESAKLMVLLDGGKAVMAFDGVNPQFSSTDNTYIKIGERAYRGVMEFGRYTNNKITAVNVVSLEEYLYGVVPSEMPSTWHEEALKAQTVAARSYILTRMGVHAANGYDVCDGTNCQVYIGYNQEKQSTNKAVDETRGIIAYNGGLPINAVFFSSSGGSTDNAENVWANTIPYLKAVYDGDETVIPWTRSYSALEMRDILSAKGINIGDIKNIEITLTGAYGRVQEVTITGTSGTKVLKKEETRTIFSGTKEGSFNSRMYTINGKGGITIDAVNTSPAYTPKSNVESVYVQGKGDLQKVDISSLSTVSKGSKITALNANDNIYSISKGNDVKKLSSSSKNENSEVNIPNYSGESVKIPASGGTASNFVFTGKGLGHGVGMSQYGAKGMAEKGYTYKEILKHYYKDITIE